MRIRETVAAVAGLVAVGVVACSGGQEAAVRRPEPTASTTTATSSTTIVPTTTTIPPESILAAIPGCPNPPPMGRPDPDRPVYTATVDVQPDPGTVTGQVTVRFTPDLATDVLVFRLWPNAPRTAAAGAAMNTGPITVVGDSRPRTSTRPNPTTLEVTIGRTLEPGQPIAVSVPFTLIVPGSASDRISNSGDTLRLGSFLPLLAWEPGVGWARDPATGLFAEAVMSPVADYDVAITAPAGYDVLASGALGPDGRWRVTAARDFSASVGHFAVASAVEQLPYPLTITVGVDQSVAEDPNAYLERVRAALRDFATRYGAYPWPTFNLAITPGLSGGIEFPAHVQQGPGTIGRTTPHEVAHMWFYGLVGNNQARDPWLDEGLASYAEFRHEGTIGDNRARDIPADAEGRADEPMTYWDRHGGSYYRGVYVQGAVGVAALGSIDQVDCALRHYVAANAYQVATPEDLYAALEAVIPGARARLAPFIDA